MNLSREQQFFRFTVNFVNFEGNISSGKFESAAFTVPSMGRSLKVDKDGTCIVVDIPPPLQLTAPTPWCPPCSKGSSQSRGQGTQSANHPLQVSPGHRAG